MPRAAWTRVRDVSGDPVEVWADSGDVWIEGGLVCLNAAQREEFGQAYIAACHEADRHRRPAPICGELSPGRGACCTQTGGHEEHIARAPGGIVTARWPVRGGGGDG